MKNLKVCKVTLKKYDVGTDKHFVICYGHDETNASDEVFTCCDNLKVNSYSRDGGYKWTRDLKDLASPENAPVNINYYCYSLSAGTVCICLSNGEIYTITENGSKCDLVGVCDDGIQAIEWSPDQELFIVVTKTLSMILMSCTFDPLNEVKLVNEEFGEKEFITVGWGKKETQFHGSAGKQAAKAKVELSTDPATATDMAVKISWRGDAQLYAVGFVMDGIRRFKVFDRDGHLQYTSERQPGLEANLSWRPSGNIIATTQNLPNKYVVAFFEKNGLKHGDFTIPVNTSTVVKDLAWSSDSDVLAVHSVDILNDEYKILLFTSSNYHWYLKQTLKFNKDQKIHKMLWDTNFNIADAKKLHVFLNDGTHVIYSWVWSIDHSIGNSDKDDAIVGVIDGKKLLLTGFRQVVIPPPMAALELTFHSNINSVKFLSTVVNDDSINFNAFFVCTEDLKLHFYKQSNKFPLLYDLIGTIILESQKIPFEMNNWNWIDSKRIICVKYENDVYNLIDVEINLGLLPNSIVLKHSTLLPDSVLGSNVHPIDKSKLFLQMNNGEILEYIDGEIRPFEVQFPSVCLKFNVVNVEKDLYFIGLSYKNVLYINDKAILNSVSSFFVHTHFILITTMQHYLLCSELRKSGLNALIEHQKNENNHVYKRKIERGAKLIIVVPNETRTVFQMPRGNLEVIQPRPLSLKIIGEYLDSFKYYEAFDLMRKQRINLNLLIDHNPGMFIDHIDVLLDSIINTSWLNLLISELENIDVTNTMYANSYSDKADNSIYNVNDKVSIICDILRSHIAKRSDRDNKILPLLTTFVKKNTIEDLETALTIIKELKKSELNGLKLPVVSDEALKYLLYMVEVNQLFDISLGMYDFDLVLLVATKSQKDPKEYVPILNEFNEMEENYKCFSINKYLKRYHRAVECLAKCGPEKHSELRSFVKYHSLYSKSLELFSPDDEIFKHISDDFGSFLKLKKHFTEAGIVYRRAGNTDKAVECFKNALEWELAIELACTWPKDKFRDLCWDLVSDLKNLKHHKESLSILEIYCDDIKATILYAVECCHYSTALRLCGKIEDSGLRGNVILPALIEELNNVNELLKTHSSNFKKHKERLLVVRENKNKRSDEFYDASFANKDSDLYSDAGSTLASSASRGSSRTFRSSKNRRKHERKIASLKEGSQYEDVALVMALHTLVTCTFDMRPHVKEINLALCSFNKDKEALILQSSLDKLLNEMKDSFKQIWTNEFVLEATNASIAALNVPEGCSVVPQGIAMLDPHIRIAPVIQEVNWKLNGL